MDVALIAPEAFLQQDDAPYVKNIREAGMEVIYPDDPTFTRGHKTEAETRTPSDFPVFSFSVGKSQHKVTTLYRSQRSLTDSVLLHCSTI